MRPASVAFTPNLVISLKMQYFTTKSFEVKSRGVLPLKTLDLWFSEKQT